MVRVLRRCARAPAPLSRAEVAAYAAALLERLGLEDMDVECSLVDDAEMEGLNRDFLGLPGPTNVLSFPGEGPDAEGGPGEPGVLALSLPTLAREAFLYGQDPAEHMLRLLSHGLLHLAGFDHGPAMDAASQEAMDLAEAFLAARP